jgi:hypothetical protein
VFQNASLSWYNVRPCFRSDSPQHLTFVIRFCVFVQSGCYCRSNIASEQSSISRSLLSFPPPNTFSARLTERKAVTPSPLHLTWPCTGSCHHIDSLDTILALFRALGRSRNKLLHPPPPRPIAAALSLSFFQTSPHLRHGTCQQLLQQPTPVSLKAWQFPAGI